MTHGSGDERVDRGLGRHDHRLRPDGARVAMRRFAAMGVRFLDDVVVLDLGDEATALAGAYLAELGATVVRVEHRSGDELRRRGGMWHAVHNAGKRSVAIDTTSDD